MFWFRPTFGSRSPKWRTVRKEFLMRFPTCAVCGKKKIEVHHIVPYHVDKDKELSLGNLITLCKGHHLDIGHLGSWKSWNVDVEADAEYFNNKRQNRP